MIAQAVAGRPVDEPLLDMVENALMGVATRYQSRQTRDLAQLIRDTPALHAGDQVKYEQVERVLAQALADRKGLPRSDIACRVTRRRPSAALGSGRMNGALSDRLVGHEIDVVESKTR